MDVEGRHVPAQVSARLADELARRLDRPVVLVGMMGVGKTSVGRRLAMVLRRPFVDADAEIARSAGMSVAEIFETYGEAHFRDGERRVIARIIAEHAGDDGGGRSVIATGGGAFCNPETRALILERGIAVWLDSEVETLLERTRRKDTRPLLRDGDPREILTRLREERRCHYEQAPVHVLSGSGPHARTVARVASALERWLAR